MNSVTCQARGERHRSLTPGELGASGDGPAAELGEPGDAGEEGGQGPHRKGSSPADAVQLCQGDAHAGGERGADPQGGGVHARHEAGPFGKLPLDEAGQEHVADRDRRPKDGRTQEQGRHCLHPAQQDAGRQDEQAREQCAFHAEPTGCPRRDRREQRERQERQRRQKARHPVGDAGVRPDLAYQGRHARERRSQVGRQKHDPKHKQQATEARATGCCRGGSLVRHAAPPCH